MQFDLLTFIHQYPPQNSSAVRAIGLGGVSSQPSSPAKMNTFRYPPEKNTMEPALSKMIKLQSLETSGTEQQTLPTSIPSSPLPILHQSSGQAGNHNNSSSTNTLLKAAEKLDHHHPKQRIEPELAKFELSQSPCNVGGLHMPNSRSIQEFKEISNQRAGQSKHVSPEESQLNVEDNGMKVKSVAVPEQWNSTAATYQHMLVELSREAKKEGLDGCEVKKLGIAPNEILDKIIESAIAKKNAFNAKDMEEYYKNHILLLSYQLNFERHEREMTAERNRRLFGSDKDYK